MITQLFRLRHLGLLMAIATATTSLIGIGAVSPALAQSNNEILRREATLQPSYGEHTFRGTAGQAVTIIMTSTELDSSLILLDPSGQEISYSNDFSPSMDSTITATLPVTGTYTVLAKSLAIQAIGDYTVTVRVATPYEVSYAEATNLYYLGDYEAAIAAYDEAIQLDPNQPDAYMGRAEAVYGLAQTLRPEERDSILSNYRRALELYERAGNTEAAQMLREQISYLEDAPY